MLQAMSEEIRKMRSGKAMWRAWGVLGIDAGHVLDFQVRHQSRLAWRGWERVAPLPMREERKCIYLHLNR